MSWTTQEVEIIRRYDGPKYRGLPPGLRKKYQRTGQLPPGWRKKMEPFPATLERECASLPAGYRRGMFDAHAVIYDSHGTIIDVTVLFFERRLAQTGFVAGTNQAVLRAWAGQSA